MIIEASNGGRGPLRRTSGSIDLQRLDHGGRATGTGGAFADSHPPQWSMRSKKTSRSQIRIDLRKSAIKDLRLYYQNRKLVFFILTEDLNIQTKSAVRLLLNFPVYSREIS